MHLMIPSLLPAPLTLPHRELYHHMSRHGGSYPRYFICLYCVPFSFPFYYPVPAFLVCLINVSLYPSLMFSMRPHHSLRSFFSTPCLSTVNKSPQSPLTGRNAMCI